MSSLPLHPIGDDSGLSDNLSTSSSGEEEVEEKIIEQEQEQEQEGTTIINEEEILKTKISLIKERIAQNLAFQTVEGKNEEEYIKYTEEIESNKEAQLLLCKERLILRQKLIQNHYDYCCQLLRDRRLEGEEELWMKCRQASSSNGCGGGSSSTMGGTSSSNRKRKPSMNIEMLLHGHHNSADEIDDLKCLENDILLFQK